jgi:hypothetical protein
MLAQLHDEKWMYRIVILMSKYFYCMTHSDVTSHWTGGSHRPFVHMRKKIVIYMNNPCHLHCNMFHTVH